MTITTDPTAPPMTIATTPTPPPASSAPSAVTVSQGGEPLASPAVTVSMPSTPAPGYLTSEGWLSFITIVLGALPTTLFQNAPVLTKIVGMAIAALAAAHYTAARTSLKRAHLALSAMANGQPIPSSTLLDGKSPLMQRLLLGIAAAGVVASVVVGSAGCATAKKDVANAGTAAIDCAKQDLNQLVGSPGIALLALVGEDLASGNYLAALDELGATVGKDALACAVDAYDVIASAGSAATAAASPLALHAHAYVQAKGFAFVNEPIKRTTPPDAIVVPRTGSAARP